MQNLLHRLRAAWHERIFILKAASFATVGAVNAVIDFASGGVGSQPHVALETLARRTGIKLVHVPYKPPPGPDVISGAVSLYLEASTTAIPTIRAGRIKALAVSGTERIPSLPDVPTITEYRADLDPNGVIGNSWHGIFTPAGTPDDIVAKLNTEIVKIVKAPDLKERLATLGLDPVGSTPEAFTQQLRAEDEKWAKVIKASGAKPD